MKVLRLIPVLDFGGVESQFVTLAEAWDNPDIQLEFCTFWKDGVAADRIRQLGYPVHVLGENPSVRNPRATVALWKFLRKHKPDIVHSTIGEANFHNMLCGPLGPWKTIIEEAGIPSRGFRNRLIHRALYQTCDRIIGVSQASLDYLANREWAPKERLTLLPNSVNERFFNSTRSNHTLSDPRIFRAVGRLTAVKNYPMLVRAFAQAHASSPNIRLEIVGEGEDRPLLEKLIQELGADEYIRLRGFVEDIVGLHQDTDFFLMPSLSEGFGLAAAEPMAMGIPGLGSRVGGLFTVFGPLAAEWLLPARDERVWAASISDITTINLDGYHSASRAFAARSKEFSPAHYCHSLAEIYLHAAPTFF